MKRITPSFVSPVKPEKTVTEAVDDVIRDTSMKMRAAERLLEQWESSDFSR